MTDFTMPTASYIWNNQPTYLQMAFVKICMETGEIEYLKGYTPDAAAQQFWSAMSREYKEFLAWKKEKEDALHGNLEI